MNQALAFGLLFAGGVALEAGLTGKGPAAVLKGTAGSVPSTGSTLSVTGTAAAATGVANGVAGAGSTISKAITGLIGTPTSSTSGVINQAATVLEAAGLTKVAAAGVIGNAYQESSWNPASVGDGGGGLWGFTAGAISLASLQAYAQQQGVAWTNPALQAEFLVRNLSSSDISALNAQSTPAAAASWFMNNWEHPLVSSENEARRQQGAQIAYQEITG